MPILPEPASALLPRAVEYLAANYPDDTWITAPKDAELTLEWQNYTYRDLSHAVDGVAAWIEEHLGVGTGDDVVSYIGVNDERYGAVHIGLMKAGYKTMLPSTRNSPEGQANLAQRTDCKTLLYSEGVDTAVEEFHKAVPSLQVLQVPSFDAFCERGSLSGHYAGHYSEAPGWQNLILHTSGSTGLPKPIRLTNASMAVVGSLTEASCPEGRTLSQDPIFSKEKLLFVMTPFFHAMGSFMLLRSILCKAPLVRLPTGKPPNVELIMTVLKQTNPDSGIFAPALLEQIADEPMGLETLGRLEYVFFGGAPLATATGNKIRKFTKLITMIGSTELGVITSIMPAASEDWEYFEWSPAAGAHMEPQDEGLYELVIRPADPKTQAVFHAFSDLSEWRTNDLWEQHPSKPGLWRYRGRKDDVIVFSNGEKLNPVGFETTLESHAKIRGAMVVGQGRFQSGLLVEPAWNSIGEYNPDELLEALWPFIEESNVNLPAHGRVWKSKVAFAKKDKPFKRAPKGSIVRQQTIKLYEREIEALYSNERDSEALGTLAADADDATSIKYLRDIFKLKGMPIPDDAPNDSDVFAYGVDSLQVLALTSTLNHARGKANAVTPRDIYQRSTIEAMAKLLKGDAGSSRTISREDTMSDMVAKYTDDLPEATARPKSGPPSKHTVVLTGSTGSLGNSILEELIESSQIEHVYCLNRSADAESRQRSAFKARGAIADFSRVTFLHTDFGKYHFGLEPSIYKEMLDTVTLFIHNAWTVDFNKTLATYEATHVAGTRRCVDFSYESRYRAHIVFISSIASVGNWQSKYPNEPFVPEKLFNDHQLPGAQGYAESKHVASVILAAAGTKSGVPSTIVRCGQLAGPAERGQMWNKHEWLPSILLTSRSMGALPAQLGNMDTIDWVPIDLAAKSVIEIANASSTAVWQGTGPQTSVGHVVNPSTVSWKKLVPSIQSALGGGLRLVPFKEWLDELSAVPHTTEAAETKPGIKLLDFYQSLVPEDGGTPRLETKETARMSHTIETMGAVDEGLMSKWIEQWIG